jgi:two-component SAPR family response regulator
LIPTVQRIVQFIKEHRYEDTVFGMERILMNGGKVSMDLIAQLPDSYVYKSPLLLQLQGESLARKGELVEACSLLKRAVQGFAKQGFQIMLLDAMAQLTAVCLRIGEWQDAQTMLTFLHKEWSRHEPSVGGKVLRALARGAYLIDGFERVSLLYDGASSLFIQDGDSLSVMELYADQLLVRGFAVSELEQERILLYAEQRSKLDSSLQALCDLIKGLIFSRREQWEEAIAAYSAVKIEGLSYEYAALCLIRRMETELLAERAVADDLWDELEPLQAALSSDMTIQFQACAMRYLQAKWSGNPFEASRLQIKLKAWAELIRDPGYSAWLEQWEHRWEARLQAQAVSKDEAGQGWNISCFGKMKFTKVDMEVKNVNWKRKKALELFVYLLVQHDFSSPKERAMETLLRQVDVDKMNNQLYVMIHQLKQTLKQELQMNSAIVIKDGTLSLNKDSIYQVDIVKYHNLIRMGDQAWGVDRELAVDLYNQARVLYGDLAPELHYADWLETYRESLAEKHAGILRKMALHYRARGDLELAEVYYGQWIDIRPLEEEGYQELVKFLISTGRQLEARRWYGKWEQVCRKELGIVPLVETKKLIFGETASGA